MKIHRSSRPQGFTLLEISMTFVIGVLIASVGLGLMNQTAHFYRAMQEQEFLNSDAPLISNIMSRFLDDADAYRLHTSLADALSDTNPTLDGANTLALASKNPDGSTRFSIVHMDKSNGSLDYYYLEENGNSVNPAWSISRRVTDVNFKIELGILRMELTGPNNEQITYSGSMKL